MPIDGLTLGFLAAELNEKVRGFRVEKIQQPESDELLLTLHGQGTTVRLLLSANSGHARIHLTNQPRQNPVEAPMFCMMLRRRLTGAVVHQFRQVEGDRVLVLELENSDELGERVHWRLVAELMGRHSNLILLDANDRIVDAIRHVNVQMSRVREVLPDRPYVEPPSQNKLNPWTVTPEELVKILTRSGTLAKALVEGLTGLSGQAAIEWTYRLTGNTEARLENYSIKLLADQLHAFVHTVPGLREPVLLTDEDGGPKDVFPYPQESLDRSMQQIMPSLSAAMDLCFAERAAREHMKQRTQSLRRTLHTAIERCEKKLAIHLEALNMEAKEQEARCFGELLTANLHRIRKGSKSASVQNYYDPEGSTILIPLEERLTPAQNAQQYFKRYQKLRAGREMALLQKEKTEDQIRFLDTQLTDLENCTQEPELEEIRRMVVEMGYLRATHARKRNSKLPISKPYRYRTQEGVEIWVGKNSLQNDRITAAADGDMVWLHAKDMPGSHVIVRSTGEPPEAAFQLAAWYSKGRNSQNVPVDYTARKYVKKPGGAVPGFVLYTHQKTRYITPQEREIKQLELLEK